MPIVIKKDGVVKQTLMDESLLPEKSVIKKMQAAGYKFYQDGKLYKPEVVKRKTVQN